MTAKRHQDGFEGFVVQTLFGDVLFIDWHGVQPSVYESYELVYDADVELDSDESDGVPVLLAA